MRQTAFVRSPEIRRPAKRTSPPVGFMMPAIKRKSVDFPAPFGPISPKISPAWTSTSTSRTATRPPKRLVNPRPLKIGSATRARPLERTRHRRLAPQEHEKPVEHAQQAARLEQDDRAEEKPEDREIEAILRQERI